MIMEEIQKAIAAHGMWKQRLRTAIATGQSDVSVSDVCHDNQCAFGKWLYTLDPATRSSNRWQCVRTLHADFHREAARILELALAGRKFEAEEALTFSRPFSDISAKLTAEMMAWKRGAPQPASIR